MCSTNLMPCRVRWAFNFKEWKPSSQEWELVARCVQKEERDRVYQFVFANDVKASAVGQLLMRKAASDITGIPYNKICFSRSKNGKPFISNFASIVEKLNYTFNVSHNGDFCVLAAELGCNVGVDVMKVEYARSQPVHKFINLMRKQFSSEEFEFICSPGLETEQLKRFYRLWCLKESYVKAIGTGIACSLDTISFHCTTPWLQQDVVTCDTKLSLEGNPSTNWRFEESLVDPSHCVVVALEKNDNVLGQEQNCEKFKVLSYDDLMKSSIPFEDGDGKDWLTFLSKKEK